MDGCLLYPLKMYLSFNSLATKKQSLLMFHSIICFLKSDNNFNVNIYIKNNVQGVNNSMLVGSKGMLRDSGVHLCLGDLRLEIESLEKKNNRRRNKDDSRSSLPFCGIVLCLCFILILFHLVLTTPIWIGFVRFHCSNTNVRWPGFC